MNDCGQFPIEDDLRRVNTPPFRLVNDSPDVCDAKRAGVAALGTADS